MKVNHEALRAIRQRSGYSQTTIAGLANIDRANYAHLEAGRRPGTEAQLVELARVLGVPLLAIVRTQDAAA